MEQISNRPVTLHFYLPPDAGPARGPPAPYNFDDTPTGLRLHREESSERWLIQNVELGSQSYEMGLQVGAELVRINGSNVASVDEEGLMRLLADRPAVFHFHAAPTAAAAPAPAV